MPGITDTFSIKRRDNLPILRGTVWMDAEMTTPVDLTDAQEVHVKIGKLNAPGGPILDVEADILEPRALGRIEHQFTTVETNQLPDTYLMEYEVTWTGGDVATYPKAGYLNFVIIADLDAPS
jgi:hypothetical protein